MIHTATGGIIIPMGQSIFTGIVAGLTAGIYWGSTRTGLLVGLSMALIAWFVSVAWWKNLSNPTPPEPENVRLELFQTTTNGYTAAIAESDYGLPVGLRAEIGKSIVSGCHFTYRDIAPLFDNDIWYAATVRLLCDAGILQERNPNAPKQGMRVTGKGMAVFRHWAGAAPSPLQDGWIALNRK